MPPVLILDAIPPNPLIPILLIALCGYLLVKLVE
jgi:hypothetical protein